MGLRDLFVPTLHSRQRTLKDLPATTRLLLGLGPPAPHQRQGKGPDIPRSSGADSLWVRSSPHRLSQDSMAGRAPGRCGAGAIRGSVLGRHIETVVTVVGGGPPTKRTVLQKSKALVCVLDVSDSPSTRLRYGGFGDRRRNTKMGRRRV